MPDSSPSLAPGGLSLKAAAAYCGLSVSMLQRYIGHATHPLPVRRVGRRLVARPSDLDAWLQSFPVVGEVPDLAIVVARALEGIRR